MEVTLNNYEKEALVKDVVKNIRESLLKSSVVDELDAIGSKHAENIASLFVSESAITSKARATIKPIIQEYLRTEGLSMVWDAVSETMKSRDFAKLEIAQLEKRAALLRQQLYEQDTDD